MDKRYRILAVDDEYINTQVIKSLLREEYDVLTALNGQEAIDQVKRYMPDLILLDVMMPDMSGFEVCKIIKDDAQSADIPIIFLTALDTHDGQLEGLELGAIDYLAKPIKFQLLKLRVRNHIAMLEQRDQLIRKNEELEAALARVKQLEGIIPICMYCKKIRDDQQSWQQLESYISNHSEARFSHGMCPQCAEEQMKVLKEMI